MAVVIFVAVIFWGFWKKAPETEKVLQEKQAIKEGILVPEAAVPEAVAPVEIFSCPVVFTDDFGLGEKPVPKKAKMVIASLQESTRFLSEKIRSFKRTGAKEDLGDINDNLEKRKNYLIEAMYRNPDAVLFNILLEDDRKEIQKISENCAEEEVTIEGILDVFHIDFEDGTGQTQYTVNTDNTEDGKTIIIHPAKGIGVEVESGTRVRVKGMRLDNELIFNGMRKLSDPAMDFSGGIEVIKQPGNPPVFGEQKILVILANFQDTAQPALTKEEVSNVVFGQANNFYKEVSYGKINLTGKIIGWYTLAKNQSCNAVSAWSSAIKAADKDINYQEYPRIIVIAPMGPSCGWGGFATTGKTGMNTQDGYASFSVAAIRSGFVNLETIGHELGHNFGNHHAGFYDCGQKSWAKSGCEYVEYGDRYDIMGKGNTGHFNALHKEYVGWLDQSNIKNVKESGTFILEPMEIAGTGLKAIKIQRGVNDFLFAEFRRPAGYDSALDRSGTSNVFKGALLHTRVPGYSPDRSLLIDSTPPGNYLTPALLPGFTFQDPASGAQITTVSLTSQELTLKVKAGRIDFSPPDILITEPSGQPTVSGSITVRARVTHPSPINRVEFYYIKDGAEVNFGKDIVAPYEAILDTATLSGGINYVQAKAIDASSNEGISNIAGFYVARADRELPRVELITPADGDTVYNPVKFSATALDDTGVDFVYFKLNQGAQNQQTFSDRRPPYEVNAGYLSSGTHTLYAEALDASGKTSKTRAISFNVLPAPEDIRGGFEVKGGVSEKPFSKQPKREIALKPAIVGIILPSGIVGSEYRAKLSATTTLAAPYEWNIPFGYGNFPQGLNLVRETGSISGKPTKEGVYNFTAKIIAQDGKTEMRDFSIEIKPALVIKTEDLPLGSMGALYKAGLSAGVTGNPPYVWSIPNEYGSLPLGLSIDPNTGVISGTPSREGIWSFAVKISDDLGFFAIKDFAIEIEPLLKITAERLATGTVGVFYGSQLSAKIKNPPASWNTSVGSGYGEFPPGLNLDSSSGYISGIPSKDGLWSFTARLTDRNGNVVSKELVIKIKSGFIFEPDSLAEAIAGENYRVKLSVRGGREPYVWKISSGTLTGGLILDFSSGVISGAPTGKGYNYFTIKATDADGESGTKNYFINVKEPSTLKITAPNGGEKLLIASPFEIKWDSSQIYEPVTIRVKDNASGEIIFEKKDVYNSNSFQWTPTGVNTVSGAKVLVSIPKFNLSDESDSAFSIEIPPGSITVKGRLVNDITKSPLGGVEISGPNSAGQYTAIAKTNAGGEFSFLTSDPGSVSSLYRSFSYNYSCYGNGSFSMQKNEGITNIWTYPFEPGEQGWRKTMVTLPETNLGDVPFWPTSNIKITSDIPVKFGLEYAGGKSGSGSSEYKITHYSEGWSIIPLNYDVRIKLTDQSGQVYYSPFVKFSRDHGCTPLTLNFSGGEFSWGPSDSIVPPVITTANLLQASIGTGIVYSASLSASGGVTPYNWSVSSGSLPDGLSLALSSGLISGTPLSSGVSNFTAKVTDARGISSESSFSIEVKSPGASSLPAPTAVEAKWGIVYGKNTIGRTIVFQYPSVSISNTASLRLYEKKPNDSSFQFVADFSNLSGATCSNYLASGQWILKKEQEYVDSSWVCGYNDKWSFRQKNLAGNYEGFWSPQQYSAGQYQYYIVAADSTGDISPQSSILSQYFLEPLTILGPTEQQSPILGTTTFQWTVASGWPSGARPYQVYVFDGSSYIWGRSGLDLSGSKVYDGPALIPEKKYIAHVYGQYKAPDKTEYISVDVATTTFWIASPTGFYDTADRAYAGVLESIGKLLRDISRILEKIQ